MARTKTQTILKHKNIKTKKQINKQINKQKNIKTKKQKGQLFSDDNPKTTVQGYGFSNLDITNKTLEDLKNRDIDYQFQVVNTMYNRAKEVIKRTKNPDTIKNIKQALGIYSKWLNNYKKQNLSSRLSKPYLTPKQVSSLEFLAEYYNISRKARGLDKPTTSDRGFLEIWREVKGDKKRLRNYPVKSRLPHGQTWDKQRNNFITRRISMIKNAKNDLYYTSGPNKGLPTKLHVNMMIWAYSPDVKNVLSSIEKYKKIIMN